MSERSTDKLRAASDVLGLAHKQVIESFTAVADHPDRYAVHSVQESALRSLQDALFGYGMAIVETQMDLIRFVQPGSAIPTPEKPQVFVAKKISFV